MDNSVFGGAKGSIPCEKCGHEFEIDVTVFMSGTPVVCPSCGQDCTASQESIEELKRDLEEFQKMKNDIH